jgi:colanic acid/amylovoran biosynthesis glycosyltransferase
MASFSDLRILVIGVKWPPETFLTRLMGGLARRGARITLAVPRPPDGRWTPIPNVELLVTPGWSGPAVGRLWRVGRRMGAAAWRSPAETRRLFAAAKSPGSGARSVERLYRWLPFAGREHDVLYFPWNATAVAYLPLMDAGPTVISCRGTQVNVSPHNPRRVALREGLPVTFQKAAAVHCVSTAIRDEATRYGLDVNKATIIRPAVDPAKFRPAGHPRPADGRFRVISTGDVIWRKGYEYALAAMRLLVDRGVPVHFEIVGSGVENQRLLYTFQDLGLNEHVTWHGRLSPDAVLARLQAADACLLSSLSEGIANVVLEGMACGLPVVTTDVGGMREAVTDGVEGFLVPARDPAATADALATLWQRPDLRARMGEAGRARVERDFRLDDQAGAFLNLFRSVA